MNEQEIEEMYNVLGTLIPRTTAREIQDMDFLSFCAYIGDPNVAPGGWRTIEQLVSMFAPNPPGSILDIGSNTGHSSFILQRCSGARVTGIDLRGDLVAISRLAARLAGIPVTFGVSDARCMPFPDGYFSATVSTGTLAFIADRREEAISEMARVTAQGGWVADTCLYYTRAVPTAVRESAAAALESPIHVCSLDQYVDRYLAQGLTLVASVPADSWQRTDGDQDLTAVVEWADEREQLLCEADKKQVQPDALAAISSRLFHLLQVFRANDRYLDCQILLFRKAA